MSNEVENKIFNLNFAIIRFLNNCSTVNQKGVNSAYKGSKYSKLSDINRVIKDASNKTYEELNKQVAVSINIHHIIPIKYEESKIGVKIKLSIVASRIYSIDGEENIAESTMEMEYPNCMNIVNDSKEKVSSLAQSFATLVTYAEKKAKQCICNLVDESEEDIDNEEEVKVAGEIEGLNVQF